MAKNYSSIYNIKDFVAQDMLPKYFDTNDVSEFNLGLLGYTTEMMSTITEDSFNTVSAYMNEIFPNLAIMPESIYNYGALFQLSGNIATPSKCIVYLFVLESDIIKYGTRIDNNDSWDFYLDSDMIIDVDGVKFKPDYDICINRKLNPYERTNPNNKFIYTTSYYKKRYGGAFNNTISDITNQYIKSRIITYQGERFLQMEIICHNVEKFYMNENVINTDVINLPTYTIEYEGYLGNFEVFYREPGETNFVQLTKRLLGTAAVKDEQFCYYKIIDDSHLEISFSSRDGYFYPRYNSEINIEYYTTSGSEGNFETYSGTNISVYPESSKYDYNKKIFIYGIPMTGAVNGADPMTIDELKSAYNEKFSTVNSYTNENDLELYFNNIDLTEESKIHFIKKRDDILMRLFSAFSLLKNKNSLIYNTNTLNIKLKYGYDADGATDFDESSTNTINVLRPGQKFVYAENSLDTLVPYDGVSEADFIYTNPFLMLCPKNPLTVGYYLNSIKSTHGIDYESEDMNNNSLVQFICGNINVYRNPMDVDNKNKYKISVAIVPTMDLPYPMVITNYSTDTKNSQVPYYSQTNGTVTLLDGTILPVEVKDGMLITNSIKMSLTIHGKTRERTIGFADMHFDLEASNIENNGYVFYALISTEDEVDLGRDEDMIIMTDLLNADPIQTPTAEVIERGAVPMKNVVVGVTTYYTTGSEYIWTNKYTTTTHPVTFIQPLDIIQGTASYTEDAFDENYTVTESSILLTSVPVIDTKITNDYDNFMYLVQTLLSQYTTLSAISKLTTNNYSIDLKFYNTWGRSKNFHIIDNKENPLLNRVNIRIEFDIKTAFGTDTDVLLTELKAFIKDYIEDINLGGTNSIYVSNLIKLIETRFTEIQYMIFRGLNEYDALSQGIENATIDLTKLTREERINFVPEYLTIGLDDIVINLL